MAQSDATLVRRALAYKSLRDQARDLEAQAAVHRDAVVAELQARQTTLVEHAGAKIRLKASTTRTYDVDELRRQLSRAQLGRVTRLCADRVLIAAEIEAGRLSADLVAPAEHVRTGAPYIDVTPPRGS